MLLRSLKVRAYTYFGPRYLEVFDQNRNCDRDYYEQEMIIDLNKVKSLLIWL